MLKTTIIIATIAATLTPALALDIPSCDVFRQRFENAPRFLSLWKVGPTNFSREPQEPNGDDLYSFDDSDSKTETDLTCRNGKFFSLEMMFHAFDSSLPWPHPYFDYIASGIYGFTGWPADKVIKTTTDIWNIKLRMRPESELLSENKPTYQLIDLPGLCATISKGMFTIGEC
jgi:hypothetical protein